MYYNNSNSYSTLNSKPVARLQVVCFHLTWQHGKTLKCKTRAPKQQQHSPKIKLSSSHKQNFVALFTFATHTRTHTEADIGFVARQVIRRRVPATLQARRTIWLQLCVYLGSSLASLHAWVCVYVCECVQKNIENHVQKNISTKIFVRKTAFFF